MIYKSKVMHESLISIFSRMDQPNRDIILEAYCTEGQVREDGDDNNGQKRVHVEIEKSRFAVI